MKTNKVNIYEVEDKKNQNQKNVNSWFTKIYYLNKMSQN